MMVVKISGRLIIRLGELGQTFVALLVQYSSLAYRRKQDALSELQCEGINPFVDFIAGTLR